MVGLRPINAKLRKRAVRIVSVLAQLDAEAAALLLEKADDRIPVAVLMARKEISARQAVQRLTREQNPRIPHSVREHVLDVGQARARVHRKTRLFVSVHVGAYDVEVGGQLEEKGGGMAMWQDIVDQAIGEGMERSRAEEALNLLQAKGELQEPSIGKIRRV